MGDELHKLFLFEFLVHSVNYSNSTLKLDGDFLRTLGPSCVQFKGKNLPTLLVSENDFCDKGGFNSTHVKFKSGKSSLFSLGNVIVDDCEIKAEITIKRQLPPGDKNYYCLGKAPLYLNNKFVSVLNSSGGSPSSQCLKICLDMKNSINENVGNVFLFLRLTCFGTVIVTEFQKSCDDSKGFLFKGDKIVPLEIEPSCGGLRRESKYLSQREMTRDQMEQMRRGPQPYGAPPMPPMPYPVNDMSRGMVPPMQYPMNDMQRGMQMQMPMPMPMQMQMPMPGGMNGPPQFPQAVQQRPYNQESQMGSQQAYYQNQNQPQFYQQPQAQQQQMMFQCPPGCMPMSNYPRGY